MPVALRYVVNNSNLEYYSILVNIFRTLFYYINYFIVFICFVIFHKMLFTQNIPDYSGWFSCVTWSRKVPEAAGAIEQV